MKNEFTKANLENGMVIEVADGTLGFIMDSTIYFVTGTGGWEPLENYNEDLTHYESKYAPEFNIVRVWEKRNGFTPDGVNYTAKFLTPIWEAWGLDNIGLSANDFADATKVISARSLPVDIIIEGYIRTILAAMGIRGIKTDGKYNSKYIALREQILNLCDDWDEAEAKEVYRKIISE